MALSIVLKQKRAGRERSRPMSWNLKRASVCVMHSQIDFLHYLLVFKWLKFSWCVLSHVPWCVKGKKGPKMSAVTHALHFRGRGFTAMRWEHHRVLGKMYLELYWCTPDSKSWLQSAEHHGDAKGRREGARHGEGGRGEERERRRRGGWQRSLHY